MHINAPAAPTLFGIIDCMQWREDSYQVATVSTHVYVPDGYDVVDTHFCFVAIPIQFVDPTFLIARISPLSYLEIIFSVWTGFFILFI